MVLTEIDGQVRDGAGVGGVVAERSCAERPAYPTQHIAGRILDGGAHAHRTKARGAVPVVRVRVDGRGSTVQQYIDGGQARINGTEVSEGMRVQAPVPRRGQEGAGDRAGTAEPARGDADPAVVKPGARQVGAWFTDRNGQHGVEGHIQRVTAGHTRAGPAVRQRRNAPVADLDGEQPPGIPPRAVTSACVHTRAPEQKGFTPDSRHPPGTLRASSA
ncbi:hypothetical protein ACFC1R_08740 [Kitasatospora sp. NPDC056138]|uniref:hypothetical protein n=1 Tax=Kitasatospora sp. NPDC056138 TaxID=3345724 RepID=UPI0035DBBE8F